MLVPHSAASAAALQAYREDARRTRARLLGLPGPAAGATAGTALLA